ncbi:hypothetical protein Tco_0071766 [Tanacetum coccineum]
MPKLGIAIATCTVTGEEYTKFVDWFLIPSCYDPILSGSGCIAFDVPPGYLVLYLSLFTVGNFRLPLNRSLNQRNISEIAKEQRRVHETRERLVTERPSSDEGSDEGADEQGERLIRRKPKGVIIRDTPSVSKKKTLDSSQKLKGIKVEGTGITLEVPDEPKTKPKAQVKELIHHRRTDSDNNDIVMVDAAKTYVDTLAEENVDKIEEVKANKENTEDEQAMADKAKDDQNADAEINSLLDIQIQQEIPIVLQEPLHEVQVSVLYDPTILPPTPPPTTTEAPVSLALESEAFTIALQRLFALEKEVNELKQVNQSVFILESIRTQVPNVVSEFLGSRLENTLREKDILFNMMMASKSYSKHPAHKAFYDALIQSLFVDEDHMDRGIVDAPTQTTRRRDDESQEPYPDSKKAKIKRC